MYGFTQRLFPVPYQWGRLIRIVGAAAALIAIGELALPSEGALGALARAALWLLYPALLWASGFFTPAERGWLALLARPRVLAARLRSLFDTGEGGRGSVPEVYEAELRDEDSRPL